jgi:hypothetical protein
MAYTTINKGSSYYNGKLYTGTGASLANTGIGFKPDFVWIKARSTTGSHAVYDINRGVQNQIVLETNTAATTQTQGLTSFDADGFTVGTLGTVNTASTTYNSFNWLAANTTASNTSGSITSTVSANQTSGFSVVTYTGNGTAGATIGHGLGAIPQLIIVKRRNGATNWAVYSKAAGGGTVFLSIQTTAAPAADSTYWNDTDPSSTVFTVGTVANTNGNTNTYVAYCFANVKGFSRFGSYTGNGGTQNAPFIYTGFKPAWILVKRYDTTGSWYVFDNNSSPFNVATQYLITETTAAEATGTSTTQQMDFLSNGFKLRSSGNGANASAGTYIYMAFAENPFVTTGGIPVTAR